MGRAESRRPVAACDLGHGACAYERAGHARRIEPSSLFFVCQLYQHEPCQSFRGRTAELRGPALPAQASDLDGLIRIGIGICAHKDAVPVLSLELLPDSDLGFKGHHTTPNRGVMLARQRFAIKQR